MADSIAIPLPGPDETLLMPPTAEEVQVIAGAAITACAPPDGITVTQRAVILAVTESMTGIAVDVEALAAVSADEFGEAMRFRNAAFRTRMLQLMLLGELLARSAPAGGHGARRGVRREARRRRRHDARCASRRQRLARSRAHRLRTQRLLRPAPRPTDATTCTRPRRPSDAWQLAAADTALYDRWAALEHCPDGSLGHGVWRFYRARGFTFPGRPNSAPPTLAQHDWIHVLADYGSTVESEIEVFGLIARTNDDPDCLLAARDGARAVRDRLPLRRGEGLLRVRPRPPLARRRSHGPAARRRDVSRREARLASRRQRSLERDRPARHRLVPARRPSTRRTACRLRTAREVGARASSAGSVSPFEPGGISPFQYENGQRIAEAEDRPYDSYGAVPAVTLALGMRRASGAESDRGARCVEHASAHGFVPAPLPVRAPHRPVAGPAGARRNGRVARGTRARARRPVDPSLRGSRRRRRDSGRPCRRRRRPRQRGDRG